MTTTPQSLLMTDDDVALATDLYELTMAAGYFETGMRGRAEFELFVRELPPDRGYLIAAGLEQALAYLQTLAFRDEDIAFLRAHPSFRHVSAAFFEYLRSFRFTGDVWAMPEGTVCFAGEPLMRVRAPILEAQVVETYLLTTLTYQTMVATKASRVVDAAAAATGGPGVVDFGSRRAHGPQAGLLAARAAYIGGCRGTSNVLAGKRLGIPVFGTAAHSWTMAFDSELEAFRAYTGVFPESALLLIDTYDTMEGARRAVAAAGERLVGVRLDSGDLADLSRRVRALLDEAGLRSAKIVASGDLDEHRIAALTAAGAPIDLYGVGTRLVASSDAPSLGGVYKLVAVERDGRWRPCRKRSVEKATVGWSKQVFRRTDAAGRFAGDLIARADETHPGTALLKPVLAAGRLVGPVPALETARRRATDGRKALDPSVRQLRSPRPYPVGLSDILARSMEEDQPE